MTILSMNGLAALSGIVVDDSMIPVTVINRRIEDDTSILKAVIEGDVERLRPILLTSAKIDLGIAPGWGGCSRLDRPVGRAHALDLLLRGRRIGADEALRIGLVHQVCPVGELDDRATDLALELAGKLRP